MVAAINAANDSDQLLQPHGFPGPLPPIAEEEAARRLAHIASTATCPRVAVTATARSQITACQNGKRVPSAARLLVYTLVPHEDDTDLVRRTALKKTMMCSVCKGTISGARSASTIWGHFSAVSRAATHGGYHLWARAWQMKLQEISAAASGRGATSTMRTPARTERTMRRHQAPGSVRSAGTSAGPAGARTGSSTGRRGTAWESVSSTPGSGVNLGSSASAAASVRDFFPVAMTAASRKVWSCQLTT